MGLPHRCEIKNVSRADAHADENVYEPPPTADWRARVLDQFAGARGGGGSVVWRFWGGEGSSAGKRVKKSELVQKRWEMLEPIWRNMRQTASRMICPPLPPSGTEPFALL